MVVYPTTSDSTAADKGAFFGVIRDELCYTISTEHGRVWIQKGAIDENLMAGILAGIVLCV